MHEVVELHTVSEHSVAQSAAVDGGVCADFDIVANPHAADLGKFLIAPLLENEPKTVRANHAARVKDRPVANRDLGVDRDAGAEHAVLTDP